LKGMRSRPIRLLPAAPVALAVLVVGALLAGCAPRRILTITSTPPGATVRLDGNTLGETPLEVHFEHYGVRRITLYKTGYATHSQPIRLGRPWYSYFPLDIVSEIILPFGWKDARHYHADLVEGAEVVTTPSLRSVIQRADVLRNAGPEGPRNLPEPQPVPVPPATDDADQDEP